MTNTSISLSQFQEQYLSKEVLINSVSDVLFCAIKEDTLNFSSAKFPFFIICLGIQGEITITVEPHSFLLSPKTLAILPPNTSLTFSERTNDFQGLLLAFNPIFLQTGLLQNQVMEDLLLINPAYAPVFTLEEDSFNKTQYKFEQINHEMATIAPFSVEMIRLYLLQILYDYNRICELCLVNSDKAINRSFQVMHQYRKLINEHYTQYKTVQKYANLLALSPKYLSECVKKQIGIPAITLIHNKINLEAELKLKYTTLSIKEISDALGFSSPASFSRFFKATKGISPLGFREIKAH